MATNNMTISSNARTLFTALALGTTSANVADDGTIALAPGLIASDSAKVAATSADAIDWSALPWNVLEAQLSSSATLFKSENPVPTFKSECLPEFKQGLWDRSNHNLIDKPSGLCVDGLYCAFQHCNPNEQFTSPDVLAGSVDAPGGAIALGFAQGNNLPKNQTQIDMWLKDDNLAWNIPSYVLHPAVAGDVVAAVNFAKDHGLGVSVKNSGHSYQGASTKKDTLHLNMNKYKRYSNSTGIQACTGEEVDDSLPFEADLNDQPCRLAKARGRNGIIRVGGGENFDKAYRAVTAYNRAQDDGSYKFHMVGGGAGTVSPMGWTFQGGLADQMGASLYGLGVDQVIRIDVVLPSGQHVRFGPTSWEEDEEYFYPKTTAVSGVCHQNPDEEDEDKWVWGECEDDINFDDLWFAIRGGGGGTWGAVTSMVIQLHDYLPLEIAYLGSCVPEELAAKSHMGTFTSPLFPPVFPGMKPYIEDPLIDMQKFLIDYLLNPTSLGISEEDATVCGGAQYCYGENSSEVALTAWSYYIDSISDDLAAAGVNASTIDGLTSGCSEKAVVKVESWGAVVTIPEGPNKGKLADNPQPTYESQAADFNVLVPATYYLENYEEAVLQFPVFYTSFTKRTKYTSDQANSLSEAHRQAGNMAVIAPLSFYDDKFWADIFPKVFDTSDPDNFPGFIGSNHAGAHGRGPLKDDWTKACPLDWTQEERDEKCIPLQEIIYGTKRLRRLEAIKEAIDPGNMFNCIGCIGNNKVKNAATVEPEGSPAPGPTDTGDEPSSASNQYLSYATLFIGIALFLVKGI